MSSRALVKFTEQRYPVLFEDFRVYIQGVEVTQWITSSLTIAKTNRDGPNSAGFTLDNAMDRFVVTAENVAGTWRDTQDKYSEAAKHGIYLYKTGQIDVTVDRIADQYGSIFSRELDLAFAKTREQLLQDLGYRKVDAKNKDDAALAQILATRNSMNALPSGTLQYLGGQISAGNAAQDALMSAGMSEAEAKKIADDAVTSELNKITKSPKARDTKSKNNKKKRKVQYEVDNGDPELKRQANTRNPTDSDTGDRRWPLSERTVIFHKNDPVRIFIQNPLTENDEWLYGFTGFVDTYPVTTDYVTGHSTITIQCYDVKALMQKMRVQMNSLVGIIQPSALFLDRSSMFADLLVPSRWGQSFANMAFEDAMAILTTGTTLERKGQGPHFGVGSLAVGKVVTYPKTDNPHDQDNKAILEEWHTMCLNGPSLISDKNSIANLTFMDSSKVDEIGRGTTTDGPYSPLRSYVHFLLPKEGTAARTLTQIQFDAGSEQRDWVTRLQIITDFCANLDYEFTVSPNGDLVFEFPMYDFLPEDFGDWAPMFTADYHLINGGMSDETGDIITALIVTGAPPNATINPNLPQAFTMGVIQSSLLASRVGVTVEQQQLPFVQSPPRLRSLGFVEFQKRLANSNSFDMEWGYRPFITVNRPLLNAVEKRMGLTSSVTETMQLFGICSTAPALKYVRQIRADGTFRFITGGDSMPISYRTIFPGDRKSVGNATVGVRTSIEQDGDPSALDDNPTDKQDTAVNPTNEDHPPAFVKETRPGTYFALTTKARKVADSIAQTIQDRGILMNNIPQANGSSFAVRARNPEGQRIYSDSDRDLLAQKAKELGYILIDTSQKFVFEVRRPGQPDFIVRPNA